MSYCCCQSNIPPDGCIRDGMPVFCGLFPSGYRAPPRSLSPPAFRSVLVSGHQPQYADCQTRTGRPVRSPVTPPPAHTSAVHGALSLPGQPADMAMMCFHSQPRDEYGETDDTVCIRHTGKTGLQAVHAAKAFIVEHHIFLADVPFFTQHSNQLWCPGKQKGNSKQVT